MIDEEVELTWHGALTVAGSEVVAEVVHLSGPVSAGPISIEPSGLLRQDVRHLAVGWSSPIPSSPILVSGPGKGQAIDGIPALVDPRCIRELYRSRALVSLWLDRPVSILVGPEAQKFSQAALIGDAKAQVPAGRAEPNPTWLDRAWSDMAGNTQTEGWLMVFAAAREHLVAGRVPEALLFSMSLLDGIGKRLGKKKNGQRVKGALEHGLKSWPCGRVQTNAQPVAKNTFDVLWPYRNDGIHEAALVYFTDNWFHHESGLHEAIAPEFGMALPRVVDRTLTIIRFAMAELMGVTQNLPKCHCLAS